MGEMVRLTAGDGHHLHAYAASAGEDAVGGLVVVQEIFGLTAHIRDVVDQYAAEGLHAIAPAMFDRVQPGLTLDYTEIQRGLATMQKLQWRDTLEDLDAAIDHVGASNGRVAVLGFCWGGTVAHVAAAELPVTAAVSYYGGGVARVLDKRPQCPIMYHFGDQDHSIPAAAVECIRTAVPDGIYHVYPGAGHGFNCSHRASFSPVDASMAFNRSLHFLRGRLSQ
jgi:carboxymethylenebutenolidase